jgi:hypothetical protein
MLGSIKDAIHPIHCHFDAYKGNIIFKDVSVFSLGISMYPKDFVVIVRGILNFKFSSLFLLKLYVLDTHDDKVMSTDNW